MKDFLEAVTIMAKYTDDKYPINCSHDELRFNTIDTTEVSAEDLERLIKLGFEDDRDDIGGFLSYKYGSN
jgi:hypothetical protein